MQLAPDDALGCIKHHGGVDREVSAGITVLPLQEFYTATAAYMREVDPAWLDYGLEHAMDAERVRLEAVLGPSRQRRVLDCSCGAGTQAIPLAELGWQVTAADVTQASLDAARAMAARRNVAVDWRVSDLRAVGSMFSGQFEWVISCMALDNILENSGLAEAVGAMREALKPGGGCYIRVRNFEQLLAVRPRYDVREERPVPHGRVIRLEDWLYHSEQQVVNVWIFLREDTCRTGYVRDTTIFAYRRRALTSSELTTALRDAGFDAIRALPQGNAWDPIQLVARRP